MMAKIDLSQQATAITGWLWDIAQLLSPFGTDSRLHWTGLTAFLALGTIAFLVEKQKDKTESGNLLSFLFPAKIYLSNSSLVDIKVYVAGRLIKPLIAAVLLPLGALIMSATALSVSGLLPPAAAQEPSWGAIGVASLLVALLFDFSYYVTHRMSHESAWLWPFHKLHHSAEVLTPITAKRNHPVFDLMLGLVRVVMIAPASGAIFGLFGIVEFATIFGMTALIALMNVTGGALRHSHIWLDFGPIVDRILISPAQHQIHHSMAPQHHDKNYGLTLAVWDWMFGTLYIPNGREELAFGIADRKGTAQPQVHNSLKDAYLVPFNEFANRQRNDVPALEERRA
jgi:sterol desaturase/sphingolipid hydroxylase (fatty acid hydroxylase superfamily)